MNVAAHDYEEGNQSRNDSHQDVAYWVSSVYDHTRLAGTVYNEEAFEQFFQPLILGEKPTPELLARKPHPYYIEPPERGPLPDMFDGKCVWTISERFKALIEHLEPNTHSFIPVDIVSAETEEELGTYHLLVVGQVIDAIVIDQTTFVGGEGRAGFQINPQLENLGGEIVLNSQQTKGRHLWRGGVGKLGSRGDPFWSCIFCSKELHDQILSDQLEGWSFRECKLE